MSDQPTTEKEQMPEGSWRCLNCEVWSLADRDQCHECGWRRPPAGVTSGEALRLWAAERMNQTAANRGRGY